MKATMIRTFLCFLLLTSALFSQAQTEILGRWKTIDDNTGKAKSVVEIYQQDGLYYGKIVKLFRDSSEDQDPVCDKCTGDDNGKKVIGLQIIKDMEYDDDEWDEGTILDPESGKIYDCKLWIENGQLKVRGYVAFFYRTQTWERYGS